jgi:hypothetical protein
MVRDFFAMLHSSLNVGFQSQQWPSDPFFPAFDDSETKL